MTIKELRKAAINKFAQNTGLTTEEASYISNSYYKLCGLEEALLNLENNENTCNTAYTRELQAKESRWIERLNKELEKAKCKLVWFGYMPTICFADTTETALDRYYY